MEAVVAFVMLLVAILMFIQSARQQQRTGLPSGKVVYTDTRGWGEVAEPLYDPVYNLTGKPDYLVDQGKGMIPVEVKTGRTPPAPYDAHIFQLAAYCLLVERTFGRRPTHGIIKYPSRTYEIPYTPALEKELIALLDEIEHAQRLRSVPRSHDQPARCQGCGFRKGCDQRL